LNVGSFINTDFPSGAYFFDTTVGAQIALSLGLQIFADSSIFSTVNTADFSNTAQLFFDFTQAGAFFSADSGHNYSSAAIESSLPLSRPHYHFSEPVSAHWVCSAGVEKRR